MATHYMYLQVKYWGFLKEDKIRQYAFTQYIIYERYNFKRYFSLSSRMIHYENQLFETYRNCTFKIVIHFWIPTPTLKNEKVYFQSRWLLFSMVCIGFISSTTTVYWNCLCDLGPNYNNIIMLLNYLLRCLNLHIISEQNKAF